MSNEELAILIQADPENRRDRLVELWAQTRRMALKEANRWAAHRSNGSQLEDLLQAAFIALMRAVDTFDPTAGCAFSTWYFRALTAEFTIATGRRTKKQQLDPLHAAVSLDVPLADSEDITLGDTIPDKRAEMAFSEADRMVDNDHLRAALMSAVNALPGSQRAAILARYWGIGEPDAREERRAMKSLRHPRVSMPLRAFL